MNAASRGASSSWPVSTVSVVIPARNAADTICEQLDAVRVADRSSLVEVVVVDSLSTDETVAVVEHYATSWRKVRVVRAIRPGANVARNSGVRATGTDAVLLCDADDVVTPEWVAVLVDHLQRFDMVCGRYSLAALNDEAVIAARGPVAATYPRTGGSVFGGLGGNCGFRRSAWDRLGGLRDHHYGADDAEFFWRGHLEGLRVGYADDAVVEYRLRPGLRQLFRQQESWASSRALLYREFAHHGLVARRPLGRALKSWAWLAVHVADARSEDPARAGQWIRVAATSWGHLHGSIRHRVLFP